jgi:hypothetical protein
MSFHSIISLKWQAIKNGYHKNVSAGETALGKFLILLLNAWL